MKKRSGLYALASLQLLFAMDCPLYAVTHVQARAFETVTAAFSASGLTHVTAHPLKIQSVHGIAGPYTIESDSAYGDFYIQATANPSKANAWGPVPDAAQHTPSVLALFIRLETGQHFLLQLEKKSIPSDTVHIHIENGNAANTDPEPAHGTPIVRLVHWLHALHNGENGQTTPCIPLSNPDKNTVPQYAPGNRITAAPLAEYLCKGTSNFRVQQWGIRNMTERPLPWGVSGFMSPNWKDAAGSNWGSVSKLWAIACPFPQLPVQGTTMCYRIYRHETPQTP